MTICREHNLFFSRNFFSASRLPKQKLSIVIPAVPNRWGGTIAFSQKFASPTTHQNNNQ